MRPEDANTAYQLAMVRRTAEALDIVERALQEDRSDPTALLYRVRFLRIAGRLDEAADALADAAPALESSGSSSIRAELPFERGLVLQAKGKLAEAVSSLREAAELDETNADHLCALCETLGHLDRYDEAALWRHKILALRDKEASCAPEEVIAVARPHSFDPTRPDRNVVSYCLFGSDAYYHECAVTNARMTPAMFPEFTARFYCSQDLPRAVLTAIAATGAQVLMPNAAGDTTISPMAGTFWRFLSFDDPSVDVVLCRDVDSPILPRERAAIDMWLSGDKPFYCLRDHAVHAEPMLAGMWGGFTGPLPPLGPLASRFVQEDHTKFADQRFLRTVVWPRIRDHALLSIDSFHSLKGAVDFPAGYPRQGRLHVGVSWTRKQILGHE